MSGLSSLPVLGENKFYRQIADVLAQAIHAGTLAADTTLPRERDLAAQMHVSVSAVREALIALEIQGYLDIQFGLGAVVKTPPVIPLADLSPLGQRQHDAHWQQLGPLQLLEARMLVECETAALAAHHITPEQLAELKLILDDLSEDHSHIHLHSEIDERFHLKIAQSCGNVALFIFTRQLWACRQTRLTQAFEDHFVNPTFFENKTSHHLHIYEAIAAHDTFAAKVAMKLHLDCLHDAFSVDLKAGKDATDITPPKAKSVPRA